MTTLRQRMDDDMLVRGFADRTRESYLWAVTGLARFYHRSPDQISDTEIQAYLVHLIRERQLAARAHPIPRNNWQRQRSRLQLISAAEPPNMKVCGGRGLRPDIVTLGRDVPRAASASHMSP